MPRYIDADALAKKLSDFVRPSNNSDFAKVPRWNDAVAIIESMPAADVAPVRRGKWIPHREESREYIGTVLVSVRYDYWFCDACGYRVKNGQPMYNFCPHCGAKMDGGDGDD